MPQPAATTDAKSKAQKRIIITNLLPGAIATPVPKV
jgi:hypothetical protein